MDTKKVIYNALQNNEQLQWKQKIEKLKKIDAFEQNIKMQLKLITDLKVALLTF